MISVIIPVHNVKNYIIQCLNSIENQTYKDIEIICVDSSDDGTTEILKNYAMQYDNVRHVIDENNSYGYKLNYGIRHARGEYFGIIDADDWIQPNMYKELLEILLREKVDFVKADYYQFHTEDGKDVIDEYANCLGVDYCYSKKIRIKDYPESLFRKGMNIWSGLYRIAYIRERGVCANESEGASFQDAGFFVLSNICADTIYFLPKAYYMYRIDNPNSSVKSSKKYRTVVDEWNWIESKINIPANEKKIVEALKWAKLCSYEWNCNRLNDEGREAFCADIFDKLTEEYLQSGLIQKMPWDIRERFESVYTKALAYKFAREEKNFKVSVIVSVYNGEDYIADCLDSIIKQDIQDMEIICVDDGSTDKTQNILNNYLKKYKNIKVFQNEEHKGLAKVRNIGIEEATGDYLLFVDGYDTLQAETLSELMQYVRMYRADIIMFDAICGFETKEMRNEDLAHYYHRQLSYGYSIGRDILSRMIMNNELCDSACLMMIKTAWLRDENILFEEEKIYKDYMFVSDCLLGNALVYHTNQQFYNFKVGKDTITRDNMRADNAYRRFCYLKKVWSDIKQYCPPEWLDFLKEINIGNQYIIYGAGKWAKRLITFLDFHDLFPNISAVMVTSGEDNPQTFYGLPVTALSKMGTIDQNTTVIVAIRGEEQVKIKALLAEQGIEHIVCLKETVVCHFPWGEYMGTEESLEKVGWDNIDVR